MKKAKLALAALAMTCILINPAARAADDSTTPPPTDSAVTHAETAVNTETPSDAPMANLAQQALGDMMGLGDILIGDMPPRPGKPMPSPTPIQSADQQVIAAAPDGAPNLDGHMGLQPPAMGKCGPGMFHPGMGGCPMMMRFHHRSPLAALEGPNALTDDQYQRLYEIKGQFIANIVPKGLNMYLLIRRMQDLLTASDTDTKAVKALEKQISSATSDLSMTVMDSIVSVDQVLTPDQRNELHKEMIRSSIGGGGHHHHDAPNPDKKE